MVVRWLVGLLLLMPWPAMAQTAGNVQAALQINAGVIANCPSIISVGIGNPASTGTWTVAFATAESPTCDAAVQSAFAIYVEPTPIATLQIVSTGTPSLNATYAINPVAQQQILAVTTYLQMNGTFPGGGSTIAWPGVPIANYTFNATNWNNFSNAVTSYVTTATKNNNFFIAPPSQPVTIP